jgi:hypothetical protein
VLCITNTWASVNSIWQMLCSAGLTLWSCIIKVLTRNDPIYN